MSGFENYPQSVESTEGISERLVEVSSELASNIKQAYEQHFRQAIDTYRQEVGPFPQKVEDYLEKMEWFKPSIGLLTATEAKEKLGQLEFMYEAESWHNNDMLMVFNLPKPLAQYWNKYGTEEHPQQRQKINGMALEWGYFYRTLSQIPWNSVNQVAQSNERIEINRINQIGQHSKDYYYLFRLTEYTPEEWSEMQVAQDQMGLELELSMKAVFERLQQGFLQQDPVKEEVASIF